MTYLSGPGPDESLLTRIRTCLMLGEVTGVPDPTPVTGVPDPNPFSITVRMHIRAG